MNINHSVQRTTLVMEGEYDHPEFTYLRLIAGGEGDSIFMPPECFESYRNGLYLSVNNFVNNTDNENPNYRLSVHGP